MKKYVIGIVIGCIASSLVYIPMLYSFVKIKEDFGRKTGYSRGQIDAARYIGSEFGFYDGLSDYDKVFSIKDIDVIAVNQNGIKTIRVVK